MRALLPGAARPLPAAPLPAVLLLLAALLLAAALPLPAGAHAHQAAWRGSGPATGPAGEVAVLEVAWHGTCASHFTARLRDPATGAVLHARDFPGGQLLVELPVPPLAGPAGEAFLVFGSSLDPAVAFTTHGVQAFTLHEPRTQTQVVAAQYQGWNAALLTALDPWAFC